MVLGSFLFTGDDVLKPTGVLSGGEKTRLSLATLVVSSANLLLLDEPTNNSTPPPARRSLERSRTTKGAVVLVSHDPGAVQSLNPERVLRHALGGLERLHGAPDSCERADGALRGNG